MYISKEDYCRRRAAEVSYDDWSYNSLGVLEHDYYAAKPEEFEAEYDCMFDVKNVSGRVLDNLEKIDDLNGKIALLVDRWNAKPSPKIPPAVVQNLDEFRDLEYATLKEIDRLERIYRLAS